MTYPEATLGAEIEIPTPEGPVKLKVPAGTESGKLLRVKGRGAPKLTGGGRGDVLARVKVTVPQKLTKAEKEALEGYMKASARAAPRRGVPLVSATVHVGTSVSRSPTVRTGRATAGRVWPVSWRSGADGAAWCPRRTTGSIGPPDGPARGDRRAAHAGRARDPRPIRRGRPPAWRGSIVAVLLLIASFVRQRRRLRRTSGEEGT